jgi:hypothetical protein
VQSKNSASIALQVKAKKRMTKSTSEERKKKAKKASEGAVVGRFARTLGSQQLSHKLFFPSPIAHVP